MKRTRLHNPTGYGFLTSLRMHKFSKPLRKRRSAPKFDDFTLDFEDAPRCAVTDDYPKRWTRQRRAIRAAMDVAEMTKRTVLVYGWSGCAKMKIATIHPNGLLG